MADELVFHTHPQSRGRIARWMLEEVGAPYRVEPVRYGDEMKSARYRQINPMGKVPVICHGDQVVTETAAICADKDGNPEPDPELRDTERVPLAEDVNAFFQREVKPHVPDAWIDESKRDAKDGEVGIVGYEINFNRYFYRYSPPRPLEDIEADIQGIEADIVQMLREVTASASA